MRGCGDAGGRVKKRQCREVACLVCRGCKWLSGKGKGALFTDLSTGNGDKAVSAGGCGMRDAG